MSSSSPRPTGRVYRGCVAASQAHHRPLTPLPYAYRNMPFGEVHEPGLRSYGMHVSYPRFITSTRSLIGKSKPSMDRLLPSAVGRAPSYTSLHSGQSSSLSHYSGASSCHPILTTISHSIHPTSRTPRVYHIPPQYHPTHIMFILLSWVLVVQNNSIK